MTKSVIDPNSSFQLGKLYADRGDFFLAIDLLTASAVAFNESKQFESYLKTINLLLRLYAETCQQDKITKVKESLQDLVINEGLELNSKSYYTLALCASYKGQDETAYEYLRKALSLGLASDNKEDICYAVAGKAVVLAGMKKYDEALKEIYNLQIFFEVIDIPEIKVSALNMNAWILIELEKYEQAIDVLWQAYDLVKINKTLTAQYYVLFNLGRTYNLLGDKEMAKVYLQLAYRSVDTVNMRKLAGDIKLELDKLDDCGNVDLIFDLENHVVTEKKNGRVDFRNQFILLDLLRLFASNQGKVYSKEYLVENIWKQSYDPGIHDNKIYVTIKRLRKLIEPDLDKPKYIFRAKNGYFMNKSARVIIGQTKGVLQ